MTKYKPRKKKIKANQSREIPDDAEHVEVKYTEPTGMDQPKFRATVYYLEPIDND